MSDKVLKAIAKREAERAKARAPKTTKKADSGKEVKEEPAG